MQQHEPRAEPRVLDTARTLLVFPIPAFVCFPPKTQEGGFRLRSDLSWERGGRRGWGFGADGRLRVRSHLRFRGVSRSGFAV